MIIGLRELRFFLEIVALKSISKAAESLHITQPALSTKIKKLEQTLGFTLFERNWEGVQLTTKGGYFLPYAVQLLQSMEDATTVLNQDNGNAMQTFTEVINDSQRLRIGIDGWLLPYVLPRLYKVLTADTTEHGLKIVTQPSLVLKTLVSHSCLDLAFFYSVDPSEDKAIRALPLYEDEMILLCHQSHALLHSPIEHLSNVINNLPFILFDNPTLSHHSQITKRITDLFKIQHFHVVDDLYTAFSLISHNLAFTILTATCALHLQNHSIFSSIAVKPLGNYLPLAYINMAGSTSFEQSPIFEAITTAMQNIKKPANNAG
ncbi:MAG TPA: LysR family transcriptional regulator [Paenalcaligenes hominis]|uniref:LysR family transcriptional regulator n=1 Tax=Paenalcaligenes hominis TaxID=643674 RepID=A0A9D3ABM7_9BURK|nr:LysR family transcriptional regulator [Paenalcaligenes hominis]